METTTTPVVTSAEVHLPLYNCHKQVRAAKIREIAIQPDGADLIFNDSALGCLRVEKAYLAKHEPKPGGYFVEYGNGYQSWSPADVFEDGYTLDGADPGPGAPVDEPAQESTPPAPVAKKAAKKSAKQK